MKYWWISLTICLGGLFLFIKLINSHLQSDRINSIWIKENNRITNVEFSKLLTSLPNSDGRKAGVKLYNENNWHVYRLYPSGQLEVFFEESKDNLKRLKLAAGWRRDSYPMLIMSVPGRLFFVGYDVVRNAPSGRSLSVIEPGFSLYELTPDTRGEPRLITTGLDLGGGLDSIVYGRVLEKKITLCAENKCADIETNGDIHKWPLDALSNYEFVEVAFDSETSYALVRKRWDDRTDGVLTEEHAALFLATLSSRGSNIKHLSLVEGIPYGLFIDNSKASWSVAKSSEELSDLLLYELSRMPHGGLISFADNNLEGRVAWNQVYYLNGLISLVQGKLNFFTPKLINYARERVRSEIDLIADLSENDYPGYRVKRYSINREPLLFALHLGRIAELLTRADRAGLGSPTVSGALDKIQKQLLSLEHTVERTAPCVLEELAACQTLEYRQGYPFWADGINVPFNYVSGYVSGLLSVTNDKEVFDYAAQLMNPLVVLERLHEHPQRWAYWGFAGEQGWSYSTAKSLNTPDYVGNRAWQNIAHITYRTMDASALLTLHQKNSSTTDPSIVAYIRSLVSSGLLLPSINEVLNEMGETAPLEPVVAKRYARSSQAWQLQLQVWALSELANMRNNNFD